jgi:hypothetical protein
MNQSFPLVSSCATLPRYIRIYHVTTLHKDLLQNMNQRFPLVSSCATLPRYMDLLQNMNQRFPIVSSCATLHKDLRNTNQNAPGCSSCSVTRLVVVQSIKRAYFCAGNLLRLNSLTNHNREEKHIPFQHTCPLQDNKFHHL